MRAWARTHWPLAGAMTVALAVLLNCRPWDTSPLQPSVLGTVTPELWLNANVGSTDLIRMLSEPGTAEWPETFGRMTVYQFHTVQLTDDCFGVFCGPNSWENLDGSLTWLRDRGKQVGIEHASLKEWDCDGSKLRGQLDWLAERFAGRVAYVAMDWPMVAAHQCGLSHAEAAQAIAAYTTQAKRLGLSPILIEGHPLYSAQHITEHLDALWEAGARMSAVHLDIDLPAGASKHQIQSLVRRIRQRGMKAGLIVTGQDGGTARWGETAQEFSRVVLQSWLDCDVDRVIVESWARVGPAAGQDLYKLWPLNLPESNPYTLTGIARTETCS